MKTPNGGSEPQSQRPSAARRLSAGALDLLFAVGLAVVAAGLIPQEFAFMGDYGPDAHKRFWQAVALGWGVSLIATLSSHRAFGVSPAQALAGLARVDAATGANLGGRRRLQVAALRQIGPALVFAPGPLLGLVFGPESNGLAAALLIAVLLALPLSPILDAPGALSHTRLVRRSSATGPRSDVASGV